MKTVTSQPAKSPVFEQYSALKAAQSAGTILLLRLGDFYEAFDDDARTVARELGITLTARTGIPMAGIPFHCLEAWTSKLVSAGHKVAIATPQLQPFRRWNAH